jgi:shikimate dehydrogenase
MMDPFDFDKPRRYAVVGNPVAHSKSPAIHRQFADQFGIRLEYSAIQVDPGGFGQAVGNFRASGGAGLNVTVPFKEEAFRFAERLSERAQLARAVNTLKFEPDGTVFGDNTDGAGLMRDLTHNLGLTIDGMRLLVLGAGGAVRGILGPLLAAAPAGLVLANRTVSRAEDLAREFAGIGAIEVSGFDSVSGAFDLVINGTAASLGGESPALPDGIFVATTLAYDLMYSDRPTVYMTRSLEQGAGRAVDGLGMLVEQAAESFALWHGKRPDTAPVLRALRP